MEAEGDAVAWARRGLSERGLDPNRWDSGATSTLVDDGPPRGAEVLVPLVLWSAIFELWLPHVPYFSRLAVADAADILWYAIGGLVASVMWAALYGERAVRREV